MKRSAFIATAVAATALPSVSLPATEGVPMITLMRWGGDGEPRHFAYDRVTRHWLNTVTLEPLTGKDFR